MKNKLIAGAMIAFALILPSASANAASLGDAVMSPVYDNKVYTSGMNPLPIGAVLTSGSYSVTVSSLIKGSSPMTYQDTTGSNVPNSYMGMWTYSSNAPAGSYSPMSIFDNVKDWLTGSLLPAIAGLVVLGISVRLAIKAVRKFSNVA